MGARSGNLSPAAPFWHDDGMEDAAAPRDVIVLPGVGEAIRASERLISRCVRSLSAADPGYFGPGSVSWRLFSHASYGISGIAAVLMQALHPAAMAAVDAHSTFRTDAWRRAHLTADYVLTITFGSREVADAAAARVRAIHAGVSGIDPATGLVRRADEPDLLLWVHAVHTEYAVRGYERFAGRLTCRDADRFVAEQVAAARLVGLEGAVPETREALRSWIDAVPGLHVSPPAAQFARMLVEAQMPLTMRPFWALHLAGAAMLLPDQVRRDYRLPAWLPRGRLAAGAVAAAIRTIDRSYLLFRPVRRARARLREVERELAAAASG